MAKWVEYQTLVNTVWGSNPHGGDNSTGLHIVGSGICALLEVRVELVQKCTPKRQWTR